MLAKDVATSIFLDALEGSLPRNFMHKHCSLKDEVLRVDELEYNLKEYNNLYVFGAGKAAYSMAKEMEGILADRIYKGLVISPYDNQELQKIKVMLGSHPIPSQQSLDATAALVEMMQECQEDDLYIFLLSGGSSALMELPLAGISLEELQKITQLLLHESLDIHEINTIRKHLSSVKGGRLASLCQARGVVIVISDIIDDDLESIGSGPLYCDRTTFADAKSILDEKNLFKKIPLSIQCVIEKGVSSEIAESPSEPLARVKHIIVASNALALDIAENSAKKKALRVEKISEPMEGEVTLMVAKMIEQIKNSQAECLLFGGECTVNVQGSGEGGRNQHAALLMLKKIVDESLHVTFLSAGTDGIDGNSDAAGAVVDKESYIERLDIDYYLENFESYNYLKESQSLLFTGPSGTNVIDIAIIIKGE